MSARIRLTLVLVGFVGHVADPPIDIDVTVALAHLGLGVSFSYQPRREARRYVADRAGRQTVEVDAVDLPFGRFSCDADLHDLTLGKPQPIPGRFTGSPMMNSNVGTVVTVSTADTVQMPPRCFNQIPSMRLCRRARACRLTV